MSAAPLYDWYSVLMYAWNDPVFWVLVTVQVGVLLYLGLVYWLGD